jgi:serine/threonine protein kinase
MGEVYRARDSRLQREVAIKVLPRGLAQDKDRLARFEREARAAGQLNHPNIMAVYDIGSTDGAATGASPGSPTTGLPYIVCELLEGATLRTRLAAGPIPPRKAIAYATQVARGLSAAHAKGIAHRDLKPENLMILAGDHVKILDFGLAKLTRPDDAPTGSPDDTGPVAVSLTVTGAILGTPSYMSPEQVRDQPSDHRTDIFALGAILYEMLTGSRAFDGPSHADRMTAILTTEPPPLPTEVEDATPGLNALIAHCIEKSPNDRFDTASDLAFALSLVTGRSAVRPSTTDAADTAPAPAAHTYRRITFRDGAIYGARFAPDGQAICYGAAWEGRPTELYWSYPGNPEARPLGLPRPTSSPSPPPARWRSLAEGPRAADSSTRGCSRGCPWAAAPPRTSWTASWKPSSTRMAGGSRSSATKVA